MPNTINLTIKLNAFREPENCQFNLHEKIQRPQPLNNSQWPNMKIEKVVTKVFGKFCQKSSRINFWWRIS